MLHLFVDDFYPKYGPDSDEWKDLLTVIKQNPNTVVTLFVIANNYEPRMTSDNKQSYNIACHPHWCKWVDSLPFTYPQIRIGYHGCRHWNDELKNAEEFNVKDKQLIKERIKIMMKIFSISLKNTTSVFRIPGHKCNPYLFDCLVDNGIELVSYHEGMNHTDKMKVITTDGEYVKNSHMGKESPTYVGKLIR